MNLTRCKQGHFYDVDKYSQCPHCSASKIQNDNQTVTMPPSPGGGNSDNKTLKMDSQFEEAVKNVSATVSASQQNVEKTIGLYPKKFGSEPVVGWLVCTEGSNFGKDYKLKSGRNFIGRSNGMDIQILSDLTVSKDKHAVVIYEPKTLKYLVQPGESHELCYLNDSVVLSPVEIKQNDVVTVGETKLMFFSCCSEIFNWDMVKIPDEKKE